jgi:UDP-N-acetylmuramoylalanine--D-glutamate ligase
LVAHLFASAKYDAARRQYRHRDPFAQRCRGVCGIECSSFQIDLALRSIRPSASCSTSRKIIDRHGALRDYAAIKERLVAGVQRDGTAIVGVDDNWCQAVADRIGRAGKRIVRLYGARCPTGSTSGRVRPAAPRAVVHIGGIGCCAARTMRRTPPAPPARRWRSACRGDDPERPRVVPGLVHRMEQVARVGNVLPVNDSKATNAARRRALASFTDIFWIAAARRTGALPRSPDIFRASPRPI